MHRNFVRLALGTTSLIALLALVSSCSTPRSQQPAPSVSTPPPTASSPPVPAVQPAAPAPPPAIVSAPPAVAAPPAPPANSQATTPLAYRRDAAGHIYARNAERIFKGKLRPQLYAIGVLEVDIDRQGNIVTTRWRRAPTHAPEVMAEILRTVRAAAPYPAPTRVSGRVTTWFDVWLWDKSGQFQLDTLTEGQL